MPQSFLLSLVHQTVCYSMWWLWQYPILLVASRPPLCSLPDSRFRVKNPKVCIHPPIHYSDFPEPLKLIQICRYPVGFVSASLPGTSLLQLHQKEKRNTDAVLHPEHGSPHPLLGLVCLSEIWQG